MHRAYHWNGFDTSAAADVLEVLLLLLQPLLFTSSCAVLKRVQQPGLTPQAKIWGSDCGQKGSKHIMTSPIGYLPTHHPFLTLTLTWTLTLTLTP